jgi:hypothetical protein
MKMAVSDMPIIFEAKDKKGKKVEFWIGDNWFPEIQKAMRIIRNKKAFIVKLKKNETEDKIEMEIW